MLRFPVLYRKEINIFFSYFFFVKRHKHLAIVVLSEKNKKTKNIYHTWTPLRKKTQEVNKSKCRRFYYSLPVDNKNKVEKQRKILKWVPPLLSRARWHCWACFQTQHTYPPLSSWTDNWTVLLRIWTLKGNLSHLIIGIQHMLFICINTNKTDSVPAQREPLLERKSYDKTDSISLKVKDFRWKTR